MAIVQSLKHYYIKNFYFKKYIKKVYQNRYHAIECQQSVFNNLISKAANTSFGKEHNFKKIKSFSDFNEHVPVRTCRRSCDHHITHSGSNPVCFEDISPRRGHGAAGVLARVDIGPRDGNRLGQVQPIFQDAMLQDHERHVQVVFAHGAEQIERSGIPARPARGWFLAAAAA